MASAAAQGFRDGVASVAQQPQHLPMSCRCFDDAAKKYCADKGKCSQVVAQVAQQPQAASFKEWTSEYVRDNLHKLKRPQAVASQNQPDVRDNAACVSGMRVEQAQAEPDMRKVCEALGFDPTNHHNAAKCPYCRWQQPQAEAVPQNWRIVLPGGKHTDKWESARVADYNQGWNDYRKAAKDNLEKLEAAPQQAEVVPPTHVLADAERLRGLHRMTTLIGTPAGAAYQRAMDAEMKKVYDALCGDLSKSTIEQYRQVLDAGLSAASKKEAGHE